MPSIVKRKTSHVAESTFKMYDGDEPRPGGYRAILKFVNMQKSKGDNLMLTPVLELKAAPGSDKAKYDGYPCFPYMPLTDDESNIQREQAFYLAIGASKDAQIKTEADAGKFKAGDKQKTKVLSIGGIKPEGIVVSVRLVNEIDNRPEMNGAVQLRCTDIYRSRDADAVDAVEEDDIEDEDEEVAEYTEDELNALALAALRAILVDEFGMSAADAKAIKSKKALVSEILDQQADAEDDEEEDDEEDEEVDEDDVEEEDEDEEEEEEDDDAEAGIREELAELDRSGLRAVIKQREPAFKFLKSQTDEALLEKAVELRLQDPPF